MLAVLWGDAPGVAGKLWGLPADALCALGSVMYVVKWARGAVDALTASVDLGGRDRSRTTGGGASEISLMYCHDFLFSKGPSPGAIALKAWRGLVIHHGMGNGRPSLLSVTLNRSADAPI